MNKMKKILMSLALIVTGTLVSAQAYLYAAADPFIELAKASTTTWLDENKYIIAGFIFLVIFTVFGLRFAVRGLSWFFGKLLTVFGRGRGRRGGR